MKPYCGLISGGLYGTFFQDMQELFYYMQIMAEMKFNLIRQMKNYLEISDIPDFMRALGFFPTDYEVFILNI